MSRLLTESPLAVPAVDPAPVPQSLPAGPPPFLLHYRLWILLLITLAGGAMRFSFLDRPPLWGDEAFTYSRVCGTYREMLDILTYDGFPPLHYEAFWVLGKATNLTPRVMRAIPATAGTLMIPAMYFLAAQIVRKRAALLVALFTCVSAYMMVYSRDAKMYMIAWLFVTLNVACLLWWLRTGLRIPWLAWIATGLAMAGFHLSSLAVLAVEPVVLLTFFATRGRRTESDGFVGSALADGTFRQPRVVCSELIPSAKADPTHFSAQSYQSSWKQLLLFLAGLLIIASAPAGYRLGFNRWGERIDEVGFAAGSGIGWVENYNKERTGPDLALFAATAHLFSWEWPTPSIQKSRPGIDPDLMHAFMIVGVALLVLMAIGALTHSQRQGDQGIFTLSSPHFVTLSSSWPPVLWLGLWIIVPAYGVYCASMREFASPFDWLKALGDLLDHHWLLIGYEIAILAAISHFWRALPQYLAAAIPIAAIVYLNAILLHQWPGKQWHAAYWPILSRWWGGMLDPLVLSALIGLLPVIAWQFCGSRFLTRGKKTIQLLLVATAIFLACWGVDRYFRHHFDQEAQKILADHHEVTQWKMFVQIAEKDHGLHGKQDPRWPELLAARKKAEPALTDEHAGRAVAERLVAEKTVWGKWFSVWMPRYVGMCWPAVAIAACALLLRLPTRPLRCAAVALLLAVNVGQSAARVFAGNEPPLDRIYTDVTAAQETLRNKPTGTTTRTYLQELNFFNIGSPGSFGLFGMTGRYYLSVAAGVPVHPLEFRSFGSAPQPGKPWEPWKFTFALNDSPKDIVEDLKKSPRITRVILWERDEMSAKAPSDRVAALLGPGWTCIHENTFTGRVHWDWQELYTLRRREYVRQQPPATRPAI